MTVVTLSPQYLCAIYAPFLWWQTWQNASLTRRGEGNGTGTGTLQQVPPWRYIRGGSFAPRLSWWWVTESSKSKATKGEGATLLCRALAAGCVVCGQWCPVGGLRPRLQFQSQRRKKAARSLYVCMCVSVCTYVCSMSVHVCACMYCMHVSVGMCVYTCVHTDACACVCVHVYVCVCMCLGVRLCASVHVCVCACVCVCAHVWGCLCVHVCMDIYIHIFGHFSQKVIDN